MDKTNTLIDKFKNPVLWLTLIGAFFWISIRLNSIEVIEQRLDKKITLLNETIEDANQMEIQLLKQKHAHEILILKKEKESIIRHYEQQLDINTYH